MRNQVFMLALFCLSGFQPLPRQPIPPGTTKVNDSLYVDVAEISNFAWQEYEQAIKANYGPASAEHLATLPDTVVWIHTEKPDSFLCKQYYRHPAFKEHPVVGITYAQAVAYCKWRSETVKVFYALRYKKGLELEYRLPTESEWEMIGRLDSWRIEDSSVALLKRSSAPAFMPMNVYSHRKNPFGLHNTIGNVAEMTMVKGLAKGGSWKHDPEQSRPGKYQSYTESENWLGFRCVAILRPTSAG